MADTYRGDKLEEKGKKHQRKWQQKQNKHFFILSEDKA